MIPLASVQRIAEELMAKAAIEIPDDYLAVLRKCADTEKGDLSSFVIQAMLENYEAAKEDRRAMCGDTGVPRWYVKIGNEARIEGGPVTLEAALRRATANATHDVPLRPNRVHPLWRTDHNNNCGIGAPEIEYSFHPDADWIDLTTVHKGGLFGTGVERVFDLGRADAAVVVVVGAPERMHAVGPQRHVVRGVRRGAAQRSFESDRPTLDLRLVADLDVPAWHAGVAAHGAPVFLGGLVVLEHRLDDE